HASGYSRGIGVGTILVPQAATGFSAYGAASSDIQHSIQRSVRAGLLEDPSALAQAYQELEDEARGLVERQSVLPEQITSSRWAEMRYERQLHDVRVQCKDVPAEQVSDSLREAFVERYQALYGAAASLPNAEAQLLRIGVDVVGAIAKPSVDEYELHGEDSSHARTDTRRVFWPELMDWLDTPIYDGTKLLPGNLLQGAAIIEQPGTTIVVPPGASSVVDRFGNNVINLGGSK
ncbi:MAG TPA: hypothetical protein VIQ26_04575, partial [Microbacteriaceae bacterium]